MTKRIPTFRSLGLVTPARSRRHAYRLSQTATPGLTTSDVGLSLGLAYARLMHTAPGVVDWGVVCLLAATCGSIVRYAGYGRRYLCRGTAAIADQPSFPQLYSATGTPLRHS